MQRAQKSDNTFTVVLSALITVLPRWNPEEMKLYPFAVFRLIANNSLEVAGAMLRCEQRSREGCRVCGRKGDVPFIELPSRFAEKKDIRETFDLKRAQEGEICKTCHHSVARYKATGKKATPQVRWGTLVSFTSRHYIHYLLFTKTFKKIRL